MNYSETTFGLVGNFVVNKQMEIKTIRASREHFTKLLRYSIFRLLAWIQRTVLISGESYFIKHRLLRGMNFDYETNKNLINYYLGINRRKVAERHLADSEAASYSWRDIVGDKIYMIPVSNNLFGLFVIVNHEEHKDLIPLVSVSDL